MKSALLSVIAVGAMACVAAAAPSPPTWASEYSINALMRMPYAGIIEPFQAYYSGESQRVDFYSGMDSYIYRSDLNLTWQVNPADNIKSCFTTVGPVDIRQYLPTDMSTFVLQTDAVQVNDQMCDDWQLSVTTLGQTSVYDMYMSRQTGAPIRYQMMGYDSLIGSHFDLYQVDYLNYTEGTAIFPPNTFDEPQVAAGQCGGFPGPGASHTSPMKEIAQYYPTAGNNERNTVVSTEYAAYMLKHGKSYGDETELRSRQIQYQKHSHFIAAHQRKFAAGLTKYTVALNFLADHTDAELNARRGKLQTKETMVNGKPTIKGNNAAAYHLNNYYSADLPTSVDWRLKGAVTRPQDQGICGSCWSFGSTGAIEGAYFLKYGALHVMAEQELMDCSWDQGNNACDGGEDFRAYDWVLQNGGMSFKENYGPYLMADSYCSSSAHAKPDVTLQSYVNVTMYDENALMDALASVGPISISIDASHPGLSFYTSGVYYDPACGNQPDNLDHSVLAVGYGTDPVGGDYWIVKNSWSTYWGNQGYIWMSRTNNNCGVATMPTYVILE